MVVRPRLATGWLVEAVVLLIPFVRDQQLDTGDLVPHHRQVGDDLQVPVL
jgi:hypothetical protein